MTEQNTRQCTQCNNMVVEVNGRIVHQGGGQQEQRCTNPSCQWSGSQYQKFESCPRCGDKTSLVDGHMAS